MNVREVRAKLSNILLPTNNNYTNAHRHNVKLKSTQYVNIQLKIDNLH